MLYKEPFLHSLNLEFLNEPHLSRFQNHYPEELIRSYCANPNVSEHESSLWGNYSAPVDPKDFIVHNITHHLNTIKYQFLTGLHEHDHHYVNYHMDEPGSYLEVHNDLKDFRWLITSQIYIDDDNQGVWVCSRTGSALKQIPTKPGIMYSIFATPFSWHTVKELETLKRTILFRVGKRKHKTVAHFDKDAPAWVIVNDNHDDTHYAKLALRMGNLTEAWLHSQGHKNIYHTGWRGKDKDRVIAYAKSKHSSVTVINSGEFPGLGEWYITNDNYEETADFVFQKRKYSSMWNTIEGPLKKYWDDNQQLNYQDMPL